MRRVAITGQGVVSALGKDLGDHLTGLRGGRSGVDKIELIDTDNLRIEIAAEAKCFIGSDHFTPQEVTVLDRVTQMALVAGAEAIENSGIVLDDRLCERTATIVGTSMGGQHTQDDNYRLIYREGKKRVHPLLVPRLMANAPVSWLSMKHGLKGPAYSVSTACSSSNHAIGQAFQMIRSGVVDAAVTGGAEAGLTHGVLKAWEGLRVTSNTACRPFSLNRDGMVQGEGAAIFVLEEMQAARKRGAAILGEIIGFSMNADAGDIVQPSIDGASAVMTGAMEDAGIDLENIDHINAHGTATTLNDKMECAAIRRVFGPHAESISLTSTKSMHGHCIGAAGAIEMIAVLMALNEGIVAPTINFEEPDPECDLDVVKNEPREQQTDVAMSNSFAFGGLNAAILVKRMN